MTSTSIASRVTRLPRVEFLRLALKLDAIVTGVNGVAYIAAAGALDDVLGLEPWITRSIGGFLVVFALCVWLVAARAIPSRAMVTAVIEANLTWAVGSLAFAALAVSSPSAAGTVWIVVQALVVGGFAALQSYAREAAA